MQRIDTIVDWILTERCNLNCYYCLQNADTRKAECGPVDYSFVDNVDKSVLFHLTGGEPFLVPNLIELCKTFLDFVICEDNDSAFFIELWQVLKMRQSM